jgi:hypothetical protein
MVLYPKIFLYPIKEKNPVVGFLCVKKGERVLPLSSRRIYDRKTRKIGYPKWKGGKVQLPTILKTPTLMGLRPRRF